MNTDETPRSLKRHISIQQIGRETLVYDELRHKAFCLNESSSLIWRLADGEHTVAQMKEAASSELKMEVSEEFVCFALEQLQRDGLIESPSIAAGPAVSRRAVLRTLGVSGALLLPMIAAVMAPPAAQAYNGCVDCIAVPAKRRPRPAVPPN